MTNWVYSWDIVDVLDFLIDLAPEITGVDGVVGFVFQTLSKVADSVSFLEVFLILLDKR